MTVVVFKDGLGPAWRQPTIGRQSDHGEEGKLTQKERTLGEWTSPPFQMRLPPPWEDALWGTTSDGYGTFVAKLRWGVLGVEATIALFHVETNPEADGEWGSGVCGEGDWWSALGLLFVPGPSEGRLALRLFWMPSTYFERACELIHEWQRDELDLLVGDCQEVLMNGFGPAPERECWEGLAKVLTHSFLFRPVTDPDTQVPNYLPKHAARLYRE